MGISTHILDLASGRPAAGVAVALDWQETSGSWSAIARGVTDGDGRLATLLPREAAPAPGVYRLRFETAAYFAERGTPSIFPHVAIAFHVYAGEPHYHVPLLLAANGYTTYRGS